MANIRDLKKDINWITEEVITDCLIYTDVKPDNDRQPVAELIHKIVDKRNELIERVNAHGKFASKSEKKAEFKSIAQDLLKTADECLEELSKLAAK